MILKSYFDGGNKADSRLYENVTLAVVSGTDQEWEPFIREWSEMLRVNHFPPLHTTDAVSRVNDFEGWTEGKVDSYLRNCVRVIEKHFIKPNTEYLTGRFGVYCFTVSINLADYVTHAQQNPEGPQDANEGCIRQAIADMLDWASTKANSEQVHCIFDQGEPFYGYLDHILTSKRSRKDAFLLNRIAVHSRASSRLFPPLQVADLFAWVESHRNGTWNPDWKKRIMLLPYTFERYDSSNLHNINHDHQAAWNTWKIPKRAATK